MTVIADGILVVNSLRYAPQWAAAEIFALARAGHLTLESTAEGVAITRTDKATTGMELEERLLLNAVSPQAVLHTEHQVPVAQTVTALTCQLLRHRGLARKLSPRRFMRRVSICSYAFSTALGIAPIAIFHSVNSVCLGLALFATGVMSWNTNAGVNKARARAVRFTRQGKRQHKRLKKLSRRLISRSEPSQEDLLAHELLWTIHVPLVHAPTEAPQWFTGDWPTDAAERTALLRTMFESIATGLNQPADKKGRFALDENTMKEAELYLTIDGIKETGQILVGVDTGTDVDFSPGGS
ncbi:hypothetical protein KBX26_13690 [Micromonospora sp. C97]|uniref:hypothetical protein n=1 Tax=Micromonospora sp. C97 TaxID=2824883 RepID=UPI001B387110|nr:hypothetical protein [Micromonospora sp. C97]MBQ1031043.1 hypothetical protein [Micromonospora sp. C97]